MTSPIPPYPATPPSQPWWPPMPPRHPASKSALVVGVVGLAGGFVLLLPIVICPLAWYWGAAAKNEIDRDPNRWSGRSDAKVGMVLGIIGTGILIAELVLLLGLVGLILLANTYDGGY